MGLRKGCLPHDIGQLRRGVSDQEIAAGEQEVEFATSAEFQCDLADCPKKRFGIRRIVAEALAQRLQQPAERPFAVSVANRQKAAIQRRMKIRQIAVVRKDPVAPPQLAHEGVGVFQCHYALGRLADMRDNVLRADRIVTDERRNRRRARRLGIEKDTGAGAFKKGDAPAVGVYVGGAAARLKTGKGKADVGGDVAVHAQQLAHGPTPEGCGPTPAVCRF